MTSRCDVVLGPLASRITASGRDALDAKGQLELAAEWMEVMRQVPGVPSLVMSMLEEAYVRLVAVLRKSIAVNR